mgnify:CR=1 FL=1
MTAIREFVKVNNHTLNIKLPDYFDYEEVEVLIIPKIDTDDFSHLNDEIKIGMNSEINDKTHEEIFAEIKEKYAN